MWVVCIVLVLLDISAVAACFCEVILCIFESTIWRILSVRWSRLWSWEQRVVCGAGSRESCLELSRPWIRVRGPLRRRWSPCLCFRRGTSLRTAVAGLLRRSVDAGPLLVSPSLFPASGLSSSVTGNYCSVLWVAVLCFGLPFVWVSLGCLFARNFGRGVLFSHSRTFCEVCKPQGV